MTATEDADPMMDSATISVDERSLVENDDAQSEEEETASEEPHGGFLHVVFHGLFCYFEMETEILIRTPVVSMAGGAMTSEHVYLAGNWLGETTYPPGKNYALKGVIPGYARFPRDRNLVIAGGTPAPNPPGTYAEFRFPYPMQINSLQGLSVLPLADFFSGGGLPLIQSVTSLSTIQIFTYRFSNHLRLQLTGSPWSAAGMLSGNIATLHIWAEPDQAPDSTHVTNAFAAAVGLFSNVDLTLKQSKRVNPVKADDLPFGVRVEEMQDLFLRLGTLAGVGRAFKNGDDLRRQFYPNEALEGSDAQRCSHIIGG